jgi:hypothetical protein
MQGDDHVGQRVGAGAELHPGADGLDVALIEEGRVRKGDVGGSDVGIAGPGPDHRGQGRVGVAFGPALELDAQRGLKPRAPQSAAWNGLVTVSGLLSASEVKSRPAPLTVEAVEVARQSVGFKTKFGRST